MFRNAIMFRFPLSLSNAFEAQPHHQGASFEMLAPPILELLQACTLKPVGALELSSRGFVSPYGLGETDLAVMHGNFVWITVGGEDKILPPAAVNRKLEAKLLEIERNEGRRPGSRTRKRIKEDLVHEMLPHALVKPRRTDAFLDLKRGVIVVDTASRRVAESVVSELRHALGSWPALPLNAEVTPRSVMTGWVAGQSLPDHLVLGDSATLKEAADSGASVKLQHQDLQGDEIAKHLEAGKQVSRLGLYYEAGIGFTLDEDLTLRRLQYGEELTSQLENTEREDLRAELDARFVVMSAGIAGLFDVLEAALTISKAEG